MHQSDLAVCTRRQHTEMTSDLLIIRVNLSFSGTKPCGKTMRFSFTSLCEVLFSVTFIVQAAKLAAQRQQHFRTRLICFDFKASRLTPMGLIEINFQP